jgi:hypothetical protein
VLHVPVDEYICFRCNYNFEARGLIDFSCLRFHNFYTDGSVEVDWGCLQLNYCRQWRDFDFLAFQVSDEVFDWILVVGLGWLAIGKSFVVAG